MKLTQCEGYDENVKCWRALLKLKDCVCEVTFETDSEIFLFKTYFAYLVFLGQCCLFLIKKIIKLGFILQTGNRGVCLYMCMHVCVCVCDAFLGSCITKC